jgi:glycosyltransferase involved in cell wall biosynthesis
MGTQDIAETVFILSDRDISVVQGSTEMYYIAKYFGDISDTHVFAPTTQPIDGVTMHSKPFGGATGTFFLNVLYIQFWIYTLLRYRPDIVYCYQNVVTPPLLAAYLTDATIIYDLRSDPCEQAKEFNGDGSTDITMSLLLTVSETLHRFALPRADLVVTLSEELKLSLLRKYDIDREDIHLLPLGVDLDKFEPGCFDGDPIKIVYIGAVQSRRGIKGFLEGLTQVPNQELSQIEFHVYGDGDPEHVDNLRRASENAGFEGFNYHGRVPHDEIPEVLKDADVGLSPLPALEAYKVSSPAKIFEYLAAGLPIIASDIVPHRRLLNEEYAVIVDPRPGEYTRAVEEVLEDFNRFEAMSKKTRLAASSHSWSNRFEELTARIAALDD